MKVNSLVVNEFDIDKVICDIDVRYYVDCSFSKDNGETWEEDFDEDAEDYVKSQLPCTKEVIFTKKNIWSGKETQETRKDWCPVIDVNEGKILDWTPGFCLNTYFKVCDQGVYVYSNQDESQQIVSTDCELYYVPNWLDEDGDSYGDYLQITVNGDGTIQDWDKLKRKLFDYTESYLDFNKVKSNVNISDYVS